MDYLILISYYIYICSFTVIHQCIQTSNNIFVGAFREWRPYFHNLSFTCILHSQSLFHLSWLSNCLSHLTSSLILLFFHSSVTLHVLCHQHVCGSSCKHMHVHVCVQCLICHDMSHDIIAGLVCMHTIKFLGMQLTCDL